MAVSVITVTRVNGTAVSVTWTALTLNEARGFPSYVVNITKDSEQVSSQRTPSTSVVVGGLMPHTEYSVTVQALTAGGTKEGPTSEPSETKMHCMIYKLYFSINSYRGRVYAVLCYMPLLDGENAENTTHTFTVSN